MKKRKVYLFGLVLILALTLVVAMMACGDKGGTKNCGDGKHTGGTATCLAKAKCTVCGKTYGETLAHVDADGDSVCDTEGCDYSDFPQAGVGDALKALGHGIDNFVYGLNQNKATMYAQARIDLVFYTNQIGNDASKYTAVNLGLEVKATFDKDNFANNKGYILLEGSFEKGAPVAPLAYVGVNGSVVTVYEKLTSEKGNWLQFSQVKSANLISRYMAELPKAIAGIKDGIPADIFLGSKIGETIVNAGGIIDPLFVTTAPDSFEGEFDEESFDGRYVVDVKLEKLGGLLGPLSSLVDIKEVLANLGGDVVGLLNDLVKPILNGSLDDLLDGKIKTPPALTITFDVAGKKLTDLELLFSNKETYNDKKNDTELKLTVSDLLVTTEATTATTVAEDKLKVESDLNDSYLTVNGALKLPQKAGGMTLDVVAYLYPDIKVEWKEETGHFAGGYPTVNFGNMRGYVVGTINKGATDEAKIYGTFEDNTVAFDLSSLVDLVGVDAINKHIGDFKGTAITDTTPLVYYTTWNIDDMVKHLFGEHYDRDSNKICDICEGCLDHGDKSDPKNGLCNTCGEKICHFDGDNNGLCDYCDYCVKHDDKKDANTDGKCDYCDACLAHKDEAEDDICDVCGACLDHLDANEDDICDHEGCGAILGTNSVDVLWNTIAGLVNGNGFSLSVITDNVGIVGDLLALIKAFDNGKAAVVKDEVLTLNVAEILTVLSQPKWGDTNNALLASKQPMIKFIMQYLKGGKLFDGIANIVKLIEDPKRDLIGAQKLTAEELAAMRTTIFEYIESYTGLTGLASKTDAELEKIEFKLSLLRGKDFRKSQLGFTLEILFESKQVAKLDLSLGLNSDDTVITDKTKVPTDCKDVAYYKGITGAIDLTKGGAEQLKAIMQAFNEAFREHNQKVEKTPAA